MKLDLWDHGHKKHKWHLKIISIALQESPKTAKNGKLKQIHSWPLGTNLICPRAAAGAEENRGESRRIVGSGWS